MAQEEMILRLKHKYRWDGTACPKPKGGGWAEERSLRQKLGSPWRQLTDLSLV